MNIYYKPCQKQGDELSGKEVYMYILKNALKSIGRSKGRNLLIGIIIFVIALSSCLGLSIRQAANNAGKEAQEKLSITAQISFDRSSMMEEMKEQTEGGEAKSFDKSMFAQNMQQIEELSIDEMLTYAEAESVTDFYYTATVSVNGTDEFEAVDSSTSDEESEDESESEESQSEEQNMFGGPGGMGMGNGENVQEKIGFAKGSMGTQGDFTMIGYSSDSAMTEFVNGSCSISDGSIFEEGTEELNCIISDELASYNDIAVGDTITIENPNKEDEVYDLTVVGIYENSQSTVSNSDRMGGFSTSTDPANQIYLSYNALNSIITSSSENADTETDEDTGMERTTALPKQLSGTYCFATVEDYEKFADEVYELGLSDSYIVSSNDVSTYEQSLLPLENLSQMALYFLIVVLVIGAVVLVVLNIFSVRERKYEVGVLTAIGMKKYKVSIQFMTETLLVTLLALVLGGAAGAVSSVPVTNSLLKSQIEAESEQEEEQTQSFGREMNGGMGMPGNGGGAPSMPDEGTKRGFEKQAAEYVSEVSSATDMTVFVQLLGIGIILTLVASAASIIFIMRYDPLKILSNRD